MNALAADSHILQIDLAGKIPIKIGKHFRVIDLKNIKYVRASNEYIDITMVSGEVLHTKEQIAHFESRLPKEKFMRVHRSFIVNTEYIKEFSTKKSSCDLILNDGTVITPGLTYKKSVTDKMLMTLERNHEAYGRERESYQADALPVLQSREQNKISSDIHIRVAGLGDEHALSLLGQLTFMSTYAGTLADTDVIEYCAERHAPEVYRAWLDNAESRIWMVESERSNTPLGYLVLTPSTLLLANSRSDDLEIQRVYLLDHARESGIGTQLVTEAINYARQRGFNRIVLGDCVHNSRAIRFYRRFGFHPIGEYRCQIGTREYLKIAFCIEV